MASPRKGRLDGLAQAKHRLEKTRRTLQSPSQQQDCVYMVFVVYGLVFLVLFTAIFCEFYSLYTVHLRRVLFVFWFVMFCCVFAAGAPSFLCLFSSSVFALSPLFCLRHSNKASRRQSGC